MTRRALPFNDEQGAKMTLQTAPGRLALMRCCMVEKRVELSGGIAFVPWGADLSLIEESLRGLLDLAREVA
jgi:hypothetical protein